MGDDSAVKRQELQFQGVSLCHLLVERDQAWIKEQALVVDFLRKMWVADSYHSKLASVSVCGVWKDVLCGEVYCVEGCIVWRGVLCGGVYCVNHSFCLRTHKAHNHILSYNC